jgi:plastocyanin
MDMLINIANGLVIVSLAVSLVIVIVIVIGDKTSNLYYHNPSLVLAEESFRNNIVTESIIVETVSVKEDNKVADPPPITISIVEGSTPLGDKAYQPNPLQAKVGSKVTWTNDDGTAHTATSGAITSNEYGKIFNSGFLIKGKNFTFVFDRPGDYQYFCLLHPTMIGKIIVSD